MPQIGNFGISWFHLTITQMFLKGVKKKKKKILQMELSQMNAHTRCPFI